MPVDPLFNSNRDDLKARLRLSGTHASDAEAILDQTIQQVRVGLFDELGTSRIEDILAEALTETPSTEDGIMRLKAAITESNWVKMLLLRALPVLFMEGSAGALQAWNDDGLVRMHASPLEKELQRLQNEITDALIDLAGGSVEEGTTSAVSIGPRRRPPKPGDSIIPGKVGVMGRYQNGLLSGRVC